MAIDWGIYVVIQFQVLLLDILLCLGNSLTEWLQAGGLMIQGATFRSDTARLVNKIVIYFNMLISYATLLFQIWPCPHPLLLAASTPRTAPPLSL